MDIMGVMVLRSMKPVTAVSVKDKDTSPGGSGNVFAARGEFESCDTIVMLEWANRSLSHRDVVDAHFIVRIPSGKPGRTRGDVHCAHRLFALNLDHRFLDLSIPHARPMRPVSPTDYPLVVPRDRDVIPVCFKFPTS